MASRHALALASHETNDLIELAHMLIGAVEETLGEKLAPCNDVACRLIAFQIAFAGNGDLTFYEYYSDAYNFCVATVGQDQLGFTTKETPNEPVYQAS